MARNQMVSEPQYLGGLTEKQFRYAVARAQGLPMTACLRQAGYGESAKPGLLERDPRVQEMISAEKAKFEKANDISRKKVFDGLMESIEMAKTLGEPMTMVAGWREIGKMAGYYEAEKKHIDISINGNLTLSQLQVLSDAELLALADGQIIDAKAVDVTPALPSPQKR